jgi:hypothetical protein
LIRTSAKVSAVVVALGTLKNEWTLYPLYFSVGRASNKTIGVLARVFQYSWPASTRGNA